MALTGSGQIDFDSIRTEFNNGNSISSYYRADPYLPVPASGQITWADFYSADGNTCEIHTAQSSDGFPWPTYTSKQGWSVAGGSDYLFNSETATNFAAYGSTTRIIPLSTGQNIQAIYAQDQSAALGGGSFSRVWHIALTKRGAGNTATTGGFTSISFRFNNSTNQYGIAGPSTVNYERTLLRTGALFKSLSNNTLVSGELAYAWYWDATNTGDAQNIWYAINAGRQQPLNVRAYLSVKIVY